MLLQAHTDIVPFTAPERQRDGHLGACDALTRWQALKIDPTLPYIEKRLRKRLMQRNGVRAGGATRHLVRWGGRSLRELRDRRTRLEFECVNADLFGFVAATGAEGANGACSEKG